MDKILFEAPDVPRRVVAAVKDGKSAVVSDGPIPNALHHQAAPGMMSTIVYHTASPAQVSGGFEETAPVAGKLVPSLGETTLLIVRFPPGSVYAAPDFDGAALGKEQYDFAPDFAATFDADGSGVHDTGTLDYDIVLDGEIWLELETETVHLKKGDTAIQHGTRHAWRNNSDLPAVMAFVLIGVDTRA